MVTEFLSYAVPSSLANFISSLYTVIDGIFVGQGVGDTALAAVNSTSFYCCIIWNSKYVSSRWRSISIKKCWC